MNALMRYLFKEDPDTYDDKKWARMWAQCEWLHEMLKNKISV